MTGVAPSRANLANQQKAYAGTHYVTAEINRPGGGGSTHDRSIETRNKTARHLATEHRLETAKASTEIVDAFSVLVDLGATHPEFYVAPKWWMENDIYEAHQEYVAQHRGHQATE
jgi:hypothetical protein